MAGSPNVSPGNASYEVFPMQCDSHSLYEQSAVMMKLTDESIAAIKSAQKWRQALRIKFDKQGGTIEIGTGEQMTKFRFVVQQIPGVPADAVIFDRQKKCQTVATLQSKIQVQTTEKGLLETREKAQKLIEAEKKKNLVKDSSKPKHEHRVFVKRATNPLAIGAQRPSPSAVRSHQPDPIRNSTLKVTSGKSTTNTPAAGARSFVRAELSRRPLRKRVIHLAVLGRFKSIDDIISQLRSDTLNEELSQEEILRVQEFVDEVTDVSKETGRLCLKPVFYNEVDARWPGFNSEEKSNVRKILAGNLGNNVNNFAPTRKTGIAPMLAPGSAAVHVNGAVNSEGNDILRMEGGGGSGRSSASSDASVASKSPVDVGGIVNNVNTKTVSNDLTTGTTILKKKGAPASSVVPAKRARQQSLSPPEDPSNASLALQPQTVEKGSAGPTPTSTEEPRREPEATTTVVHSITTPRPSRDWSKEFAEPRSLSEAEKLYALFLEEYPIYLKCYNRLSTVAKEFTDLEKQLNETPRNTREHEKVERAIQAKFVHYHRDTEFQERRQKHADLRAKLEVIKKRIAAWESNHKKQYASKSVEEKKRQGLANHIQVS